MRRRFQSESRTTELNINIVILRAHGGRGPLCKGLSLTFYCFLSCRLPMIVIGLAMMCASIIV